MHRRWKQTLVFLGGLVSCGVVWAHDGHDDAPDVSPLLRTWTHASGRYQVHGTFVALHADQIQIRREDGQLVDIKLKALSGPDVAWVERRRAEIARLNEAEAPILLPILDDNMDQREAPAIYKSFLPFSNTLKLRWDDDYFFVESNGMPDHRMMVGIRAWQQQVPLPQAYNGANAWRIPLHPVPARRPMSAKENFFRGAIALAVNGVPIFNPIKNDGRTDTLLAGELDEFGGHCGRADDYHYHIAPVHLEAKVGKGKPLAYALDGYPIYGYDEPDGSKVVKLDRFNGHDTAGRTYHYHATRTYPYLNGGFHGEVSERGGQVDPQPQAQPVRAALPPLRGARITQFANPDPNHFSLTYEIQGRKNVVQYALEPGGAVVFRFVDDRGRTTLQTYRRRERPPGPPPRDEPKRQRSRPDEPPLAKNVPVGGFLLRSPVVESGGRLPREFTGDGAGISPPLEWVGAPEGTQSFALIMHHEAPDGVKWYWIVHDIPPNVTGLTKGVTGVGKVGGNSINRRLGYAPPHSKGPGDKRYTLTLYALSAPPRIDLPAARVNRDVLLRAMKGLILDTAELTFISARAGSERDPSPPRRDNRKAPKQEEDRER